MRQYHLKFLCEHPFEPMQVHIVRAKSEQEAIKKIQEKLQTNFITEYSFEYFDLETYPLTDKEVKDLISSDPERIDGKTLGKLTVWFNDRDLDDINELFNNDNAYLTILERCLFLCDITIDYSKLENLRELIGK